MHPVDDFGAGTKPALLGVHGAIVEHKFDMKWLIGELVSSQTYQLAVGGEAKDAYQKQFELERRLICKRKLSGQSD